MMTTHIVATQAGSKFHPIYTPLLKSCKTLKDGKCIHARIRDDGLEQDAVVASQMMNMYIRLRDVDQARAVFDKLEKRDVVTWTAMITAYAQRRQCRESLFLFHTMAFEGVRANEVTMVVAVGACTQLRELRSIHRVIAASGIDVGDVVLSTNLIHTYAKCGSLKEARSVFDGMRFRNVVTWNAMINACVDAGCYDDALHLFQTMNVRPSNITFITLLKASGARSSSSVHKLHRAAQSLAMDMDPLVVSALISAYAKCGSLDEAEAVFKAMEATKSRALSDVVCWTTMVGALARSGRHRETLRIFWRMELEGLRPDVVTMIHVLGACGEIGWLKRGKLLHARAVAEGMTEGSSKEILASALANMYNKCGSPDDGHLVMERVDVKDQVCWNGMIAAYAHHDHALQEGVAMELISEMLLEGVQVSCVTYLNVIHACGHKGLIAEAIDAFRMMRSESCLEPIAEHFSCLADAFARVGRLGDAHELLEQMPFEPSALAWKAMMSACKLHGDPARAALAAANAIRLDPQLHEPYVLLFNNVCDAA